MRLRPGLTVLRSGPSSVQIGTDPRWAVRVDDLTQDEAHALATLGPNDDLASLAEAGPTGADPAGADLTSADATAAASAPTDARAHHRLALVAQELAQAGLVTAEPLRSQPGPLGAERLVAALLGRPDPATTRGRHTVGIVGLGPIGLTIATTLAASGVGTLLLDDPRTVRSADAGACGYRWEDVGSPRERVAARAVHDVAPRAALAGGRPDVVVLVVRGAVDPEHVPGLLTAGVVHLPVVEREGDVVVGPLVAPGRGPCLRCLDLHRTDVDPRWPGIAHQLAAPPGPGRADLGAGEVPTVAAVCAGIAAAAVLAHLDGGATPLRGASVEVGVPHALPVRRSWAVHPSCGCTVLPPLS